jgi:hemin uptake protein HemP
MSEGNDNKHPTKQIKQDENCFIKVSEGRVESRNLFCGHRELTIAHENEDYRLRITANNKLILTK